MAASSDPQSESPEPGLSLDELTAAFAEAMGRPRAPQTPFVAPTVGEEISGAEAEAGEETLAAEAEEPIEAPLDASDDPCEISPASILEAMLFVGNRASEPISAARAAELMRGVEPGEIPDLVERLNRRYLATGCPFQIVGEGEGYRLTLRAEFSGVRNKFYGRIREARLSQAAIDVLSIVAYRQPITAENVSKLRDAPSSALLTQLVRRRLLEIERPADKPRTVLYRTSPRFLQLFGLRNLDDLPQSDDLDSR